jgi:hypothetical protein
MTNIDHRLHNEICAAGQLKEHLQVIENMDVETVRDTIEGQYQLNELIALATEEGMVDATLCNSIQEMIDKLKDRKDRIEKRISLRREAILAAMVTAEIHKLEVPTATLSRKKLPPTALILEEAEIPSDFWEPQAPKLSKKAVLEALKAGQRVPGAQLSNGGETLQIRT